VRGFSTPARTSWSSTGRDWAVAFEAKAVVGDIAEAALVPSIIRCHVIDVIIHFADSIVVPEIDRRSRRL